MRSYGLGVMIDPCPTSLREVDTSQSLERLRCDLLNLHQPCGLLNIIVPSIEKIEHDHCYHMLKSALEGNQNVNNNIDDATVNASRIADNDVCTVLDDKHDITPEDVLEGLQLNSTERLLLEVKTRGQNNCSQWFEERRLRITGSKCGRILTQKQKTIPLLHFCLHQKPFVVLPNPIAWGQEN